MGVLALALLHGLEKAREQLLALKRNERHVHVGYCRALKHGHGSALAGADRLEHRVGLRQVEVHRKVAHVELGLGLFAKDHAHRGNHDALMVFVDVDGVVWGGELDDDVALAGEIVFLDFAYGLSCELVVDDAAVLHRAGEEDFDFLGVGALGDFLGPVDGGTGFDGAKLFELVGLTIHLNPFGDVFCLL